MKGRGRDEEGGWDSSVASAKGGWEHFHSLGELGRIATFCTAQTRPISTECVCLHRRCKSAQKLA